MDRNTIIGFALIGAILIGFNWFNRPTPEEIAQMQQQRDSIAAVDMAKAAALTESKVTELQSQTENGFSNLDSLAKANRFGEFVMATEGNEEVVTIENSKIKLAFTTKGGRLLSAQLKEYRAHDSLPLILFEKEELNYGFTFKTASDRIVNTNNLYFTPTVKENQVIMRLAATSNSWVDFIYTVAPDNYMISLDIQARNMENLLAHNSNSIDMNWDQLLRQQEKGRKFEQRYANINYKYTHDDVETLSESKDDRTSPEGKIKWIAYTDQFFATLWIAESDFTSVNLKSEIINDPTSNYLKKYHSDAAVEFDPSGRKSTSFQIYLGPNHYPTLRSYDAERFPEDKLKLDRIIPLGWGIMRWINKWLVIPVFNFLDNYIGSYGIIIMLLTLFIKLLLFPLTYKSHMSSAKMRVLRPQIEEINKKHPGQENAMERQKETMALYSRVGVSPMSGCLPMILQMPILFAMFTFFPTSIELRQQSFLWAQDLSTYDAIFTWNANIPLISTYFGNHLSLFCLLMTITNIISTRYNMENTNTGQEQMPGMKMMMYTMPLMFLFIFNDYASGLSYYYFLSTLITIIQTTIMRRFINEDKLLATLHANAKKPKKKSGFMARLEEAQKMQQKALREQQQRKNK